MQEAGIVPEAFFGGVEYSGAHDRTARMVQDRRAELGAVNSEVLRAMLRDGRLSTDDIRIVEESPPYADYVWAIQPGFSDAFGNRMRDAFLSLSPAVERHVEILDGLGAGGFLPAGLGDFARLHDAMHSVTALEPGHGSGHGL
jgi:phosphonate transport system substrate-binding protein